MQPEKFKVKLEHWAEYNSSQADIFRKLAMEAGEMGILNLKAELLLAAGAMERAGSHLRRKIEKS